jgi:hypothetical protein
VKPAEKTSRWLAQTPHDRPRDEFRSTQKRATLDRRASRRLAGVDTDGFRRLDGDLAQGPHRLTADRDRGWSIGRAMLQNDLC